MTNSHSILAKIASWLIHAFTSSGAIIALFTIQAIFAKEYQAALFLTFVAMFVDTFDGFLARKVKVWEILPSIDGKLLDLVIDFTNFVFVPAIFLYNADLIPEGWKDILISFVILSGCYNYGLAEDSSEDGYFIGFPAAWNFVCYYFITLETSQYVNAFFIIGLSILHFVPIKFIYLTKTRAFPKITLTVAVTWAIAGCCGIYYFGNVPQLVKFILIAAPIYMIGLGIYASIFGKKEA